MKSDVRVLFQYLKNKWTIYLTKITTVKEYRALYKSFVNATKNAHDWLTEWPQSFAGPC